MKFQAELKENPLRKPNIVPWGIRCKDKIREGSSAHKIYTYLEKYPEQALTSRELSERLGIKVHPTTAKRLVDLEFLFRSSFKAPTFGKFGAYLYSWSQKSIWKRVWELTPKTIKNCISLLYRQPLEIFSVNDLVDLTDANRYHLLVWLDIVYGKKMKKEFGFPLVKKKHIEGIRSFYYNPRIDEETFQAKYETYYKKNVLKERSISKLSGEDFQDWASWTFSEYLKLKNQENELIRFDREPVDYIIKIKMDISDLYINKKKEIITHKYLVSCKAEMHRPVSSNYILGMSGAAKEGLTFDSQVIFQIRNSIPVLLCIKANEKAWSVATRLGVYIFDLYRLVRMYEVVKGLAGKEHPKFKSLKLKIEAFREYQKRGYRHD